MDGDSPLWFRFSDGFRRPDDPDFNKNTWMCRAVLISKGEIAMGRDRSSVWMLKGGNLFVVCPECREIVEMPKHGVKPYCVGEPGHAIGVVTPSFVCNRCPAHMFLCLEEWDPNTRREEKFSKEELERQGDFRNAVRNWKREMRKWSKERKGRTGWEGSLWAGY